MRKWCRACSKEIAEGDEGPRGPLGGFYCKKCTRVDVPATRVVNLVPKESKVPESSLVRMLEQATQDAREGKFHFVILATRSTTGAVSIRMNEPVDEVQALGLCQVASHMVMNRLRKL